MVEPPLTNGAAAKSTTEFSPLLIYRGNPTHSGSRLVVLGRLFPQQSPRALSLCAGRYLGCPFRPTATTAQSRGLGIHQTVTSSCMRSLSNCGLFQIPRCHPGRCSGSAVHPSVPVATSVPPGHAVRASSITPPSSFTLSIAADDEQLQTD
ncbi:hypothetical protein BDW62DRAFT_28179 [Aspergillus aurantiobrunneus]